MKTLPPPASRRDVADALAFLAATAGLALIALVAWCVS